MVVLMRTYVPFLLMLTLNFVVFKRLKRSKAKVGFQVLHHLTLTPQARKKAKSRAGGRLTRKEYKFIVSALFIDLAFLIYYLPNAVHTSVWIANMDKLSSWDLLSLTVFDLYFNLSQLCILLYLVSTILMFTVLNSYFRQELIHLFRLQRLFTHNLGLTNQSSSTSLQRPNYTNFLVKQNNWLGFYFIFDDSIWFDSEKIPKLYFFNVYLIDVVLFYNKINRLLWFNVIHFYSYKKTKILGIFRE